MSRKPISNLTASVRQRLQNISRSRKEPFDLVLSRYAVERLLYRLSLSTYADRFLLKGAMLFPIWFEEMHRPTRDVDLLGFSENDEETLERIFKRLCAMDVEEDGLIFDAKTVKAERIQEDAAYTGIRVTLVATLEKARIPVQADIGFGDVVTPSPEEVTFPTLLDFPSPKLRAYPIYTVVAEKLEAMVSLGETNSRMKDFFDIWFLSQRFEFDGRLLAEAIQATFVRRLTKLPEGTPVALTDEFAMAKATQWKAFLSKNRLTQKTFNQVTEDLRNFLTPSLFESVQTGIFPSVTWFPDRKWQ
jgi:predicted nucleotidyltransferase component of viral defense system